MRSTPIIFSLLAMLPVELRAEEPSPSELDVAREQFNQGVAAAKQDRWEEAYDAFSRAHRLTGKPSILFNLAGAQMKTARWVEAQESYRRFLVEAGDDQAHAKSEAQRLLAELEPRVPRLTISLERRSTEDGVSLDGSEVPAAALGSDLPVNPGRHLIVRARNGTEIGRAEIEIREAEQLVVTIAAPAQVAEPTPPPPPPPLVPPAIVATEPEEASSIWTEPWLWVVVGAVVAGTVAAGVVVTNRERTPNDGTSGIVLRGLDP